MQDGKAVYRKLELKDIIFDQSNRQRGEHGSIGELAASIERFGQLQPVGVEEGTGKLVWGARRYLAITAINNNEKPIKVLARIVPKDLDEVRLQEIELEENIQREDLRWDERCDAERRIDELKKKIHGTQEEAGRAGWSTRKTAELLDKDHSGILSNIEMSKILEVAPELRSCKSQAEAKKAFNKLVEKVAVEQLAKDDSHMMNVGAYKHAKNHYMIGDCIEGLKAMDKARVNLAIVDPPFGIDLQKQKKVNVDRDNIDQYNEVSSGKYMDLILDVATELYRIMSDDAWAVWWFGIEHYWQTYTALLEAKWQVDKVPAIWVKLGASGQTNQPETHLGKVYDTFFICRKGSPSLALRGQPNVFPEPPVNYQSKIHPTERPLKLTQDIIKLFAFPGTVIVSPFLGSGVDLRAAYSLGYNGFGWDMQEEYKKKFLVRVSEDIENGLYEQT